MSAIIGKRPSAGLKPNVLDDVSSTIGGYIAEQIPDGACIQLGIGAIPTPPVNGLKTKHDLGIHTEMFTDSNGGAYRVRGREQQQQETDTPWQERGHLLSVPSASTTTQTITLA